MRDDDDDLLRVDLHVVSRGPKRFISFCQENHHTSVFEKSKKCHIKAIKRHLKYTVLNKSVAVDSYYLILSKKYIIRISSASSVASVSVPPRP